MKSQQSIFLARELPSLARKMDKKEKPQTGPVLKINLGRFHLKLLFDLNRKWLMVNPWYVVLRNKPWLYILGDTYTNTFSFPLNLLCSLGVSAKFTPRLRNGWREHLLGTRRHLSSVKSLSFFLPLTNDRVWVLRKHGVTGRARWACRGLWASCSSCCSTRLWLSASRWWSERQGVWPNSHGSPELQVKTHGSSCAQTMK